MKVGFIGLGSMGSSMATNLIKAGHDLKVYNRSPGRSAALVALGASNASTIAEVCSAQVVVTMLADDAAVSEVAFAPAGLIHSMPANAIHLSMSTISVALSRQLSEAHAHAGHRYLAAPVFGRPNMAALGKLFIIPAGDHGAIKECQPLFDAMGQKSLPIGDEPSAANLVKLSGNFLLAAAIEALGEAIALVGKAGIDRQAYVDILTSTLFNAPAYATYGALIAQSQFEPPGFAAPLGYKDIRLALAAAESLGVPMPLASLLRDRFLRLLANGGRNLDWCAIGGLASLDAGAVPRAASHPAQ
jgi:3-hydroxyisobutyrate dehydrogenase-like beta-hydroxyacid dehydrogenase